MKWEYEDRNIMMGYSFYGRVQQSLVINRTGDKYPYEYDKVRGNTGKNGIWIFEVTTISISSSSTITQPNVATVSRTVVHSTKGKNCSI